MIEKNCDSKSMVWMGLVEAVMLLVMDRYTAGPHGNSRRCQ